MAINSPPERWGISIVPSFPFEPSSVPFHKHIGERSGVSPWFSFFTPRADFPPQSVPLLKQFGERGGVSPVILSLHPLRRLFPTVRIVPQAAWRAEVRKPSGSESPPPIGNPSAQAGPHPRHAIRPHPFHPPAISQPANQYSLPRPDPPVSARLTRPPLKQHGTPRPAR